MKLSKLYGTEISSEDKKRRGYILGVSCVGERIDGFFCCDNSDKEFFAKAENFKLKGESVTFVSTGKPAENSHSLKLGRAVFTENGGLVGLLDDCVFEGEIIKTACIGKKKYDFSHLTIGDIIIIKGVEIAAKDMFINAICGG